MRLFRFLRALWRSYWAVSTGNAAVLTDEQVEERRDICAACPRFTESAMAYPKCSVCDCFVELKTVLPTERCPEGRWPAILNRA